MGAIFLGIGMFMFLVVIHELGHFLIAKKNGVHVKEFGVGIPPKVTKLWTDKSGTEYTINRIPLGGFVRLKGEDPTDEETFLAKNSFITASLWRKILILLGGVIVNALFAWLAFSAAFWVGTKPISVLPESALSFQSESYLMPSMSFGEEQGFVEQLGDGEETPAILGALDPNGLGAQMGLTEGSTILSVNGTEVTADTLGDELQKAIGGPLTIRYRPPNSEEIKTAEGMCDPNSCLIGAVITGPGYKLSEIKMSLPDALMAGLHEIRAETVITMKAIGSLGKSLFSFNKEKISGSVDKLSGPVGIVAFGQQLFYDQGWIGFLAFTGIISLALALFNILPIPALDGGRIVSVLIQSLGRFSPSKYFVIENYINIFFFVLLMIFGIFIIYKDIIMVSTFY